MSTIMSSIKKRPVLTYFVLTFALSWSGTLLVIGGPGNILVTPEQTERLFLTALVVMFMGPCIAGILLTGLVYGRAGFHELLSRLLRWQVGARWYAIALLTIPFLAMAILLALSLLSPTFLPGIFASDDKASLLLLGIAGGLGAGIFEELGWTGFAIPELRRRYSVITTGLIVGFLWGAWHLLPYSWGSGDSSGALSLAILLPALLSPMVVLPAYRVLMVWVYDHTGSLFVAILMHSSLTASTLIIQPLAPSGMTGLTYSLVLAAALWALVAVVHRQETLPQQARAALHG